ncbi:SDR16C5 [Bugula neritina]|uniref:SDR16C5 n=1 Tax=Bugula neritina TaxID=10212 RepID=A0A7J7KID0_BUGNE|nr:SDR16C5 [Bugula neritina]
MLLTLYYILVGIIKAILPAKLLPKKSVTKEKVLITGAGSGIGRALAIHLAKLDCELILWDINEKGNEETAEKIKKFDGVVHTYTVDLSRKDEIYSTADKVKREVGDVNILVNNAGVVTGKRYLQSPDGLIEKSMSVNVMAHFWTTKAFLPSMLEKNHGHIVSIASSAGLVGVNGLADYCASKFAAVGFMESLSVEIATAGKEGVHTTVVCPYAINTGMFDGFKDCRFPSILPILETEYVVEKIVDAILTNQEALYLPRAVYLLTAMKGLMPVKAGLLLHKFFGTTSVMDEFRGRPTKSD